MKCPLKELCTTTFVQTVSCNLKKWPRMDSGTFVTSLNTVIFHVMVSSKPKKTFSNASECPVLVTDLDVRDVIRATVR